MTAEPIKLKPCPFCGGTRLRIKTYDIDCIAAHVECLDCDDMRGPMSAYKHRDKNDAEIDAAEQWNTRSGTESVLTPPTE